METPHHGNASKKQTHKTCTPVKGGGLKVLKCTEDHHFISMVSMHKLINHTILIRFKQLLNDNE